MGYQVIALDATEFANLYGLDRDELAKRGVERHTVLEKPGYPCRVSLVDCDVGEKVLLMNYEHQPADTPYRSSHAIFVRDGAETAVIEKNTIPELLRIRTLSVRAFDSEGAMVDAEVIDGEKLANLIDRMFEIDSIVYLQVHNAGRGCFDANIVRA